MWFIFPQLVDLGRSATARKFGIAGLQEARDSLTQLNLRSIEPAWTRSC